MKIIAKQGYTLILSHDPCDLFKFYNVKEMHGLSLKECQNHKNTSEGSYIAGLCNFIPKESGEYNPNDAYFVFINTMRCTDEFNSARLIMHEMMHMSLKLHGYDLTQEESIITWAEEETGEVYKHIKSYNNE